MVGNTCFLWITHKRTPGFLSATKRFPPLNPRLFACPIETRTRTSTKQNGCSSRPVAEEPCAERHPTNKTDCSAAREKTVGRVPREQRRRAQSLCFNSIRTTQGANTLARFVSAASLNRRTWETSVLVQKDVRKATICEEDHQQEATRNCPSDQRNFARASSASSECSFAK